MTHPRFIRTDKATMWFTNAYRAFKSYIRDLSFWMKYG
jgi:hypothetical protein